MKPLAVSVVMPVHDTPSEWLDAAVASVMTHDSRHRIELVICDDGSSRRGRAVLDETVDRWRVSNPSIPLVLVEQEHRRGPAAARNRAARAARGSFLLWLDSDDELEPGAVDALVDHAVVTGAEMVVGRCWVEEATGVIERDPGPYLELGRAHHGTMHDPLAQVIFSVQPQLVDANAFHETGGFDGDYQWAEISEFFLRFAGCRGLDRIEYLAVIAYRYRRRKGSLSSHRKELMDHRRRALRAYCKRYVKDVTVDDLGYLGRSPVTGAQHFRILTTSGEVVSDYEKLFFPAARNNAAPEEPAPLEPMSILRGET